MIFLACRLAILLCLAGQCAQAVGLPMLVRSGNADRVSRCGCCPADRSAAVCCCAVEIPEVAKTSASPKSCCSPGHVRADENSADTNLNVVLLAGVFARQCHGANDENSGQITPECPPDVFVVMNPAPAERPHRAFSVSLPVSFDAPPTPPPPRCVANPRNPLAPGLSPGEAGVLTVGGNSEFVSPARC